MAHAVLLVNLVLAFAEVGMIVMVQGAYTSWAYVGNESFGPVHEAWAGVVDLFIHPLSIATVVALAVMVLLRPRQLPWWVMGVAVAIQVAIFTTTNFMWATWQHTLGATERIRDVDGGLVTAYEQIMSTHGIRVGLVVGYGFLLLAFALLRRPALERSPSEAAV